MSRPEIEKRNLIGTVSEYLVGGQADLTGVQGIGPMNLIEVELSSPLFRDFMDSYKGEINEHTQGLAERTFGKEPSNQAYGVLVDRNLRYTFAFNKKFADWDRDKQRIIFKSVGDIFIEHCSGQDLSQIKRRESMSGRWSDVFSARESLLDRIKTAYKENEVELRLRADRVAPFFLVPLVTVPYRTSAFKDFIQTYKGEVDEFKRRFACEVFGDDSVGNQYGMFLTPNLEIRFAFNNQFGRYDAGSKSVIYTPAEEVLLDKIKRPLVFRFARI